MARTAYILTFDRDDNRDYISIHDKIVGLEGVLSWFHYIKSSYLLICSTESASRFNSQLLQIFPDKRYLLMEVNLSNRNGRMPPEAWTWIKKQAQRI